MRPTYAWLDHSSCLCILHRAGAEAPETASFYCAFSPSLDPRKSGSGMMDWGLNVTR
jgi:hypothetical protein